MNGYAMKEHTTAYVRIMKDLSNINYKHRNQKLKISKNSISNRIKNRG